MQGRPCDLDSNSSLITISYSISLITLIPLVYLSLLACIELNSQRFAIGVSIAEARSIEPPKLYDTLRALKHPQGVDQALSYLEALTRAELRAIRVERLQRALIRLACPSNAELSVELTRENVTHTTTRALRALSLLEKLQEVTEPLSCLRAQWERTAQPRRASSMYGQQHVDLIARRASRALSRLGRVDLLIGATHHPDPEVRSIAASAGVDPQTLCALHADHWPLVRRAALRGLTRIAGPESVCLTDYLDAPTLATRLDALRGLGRLTDQPWARTDRGRRTSVQTRLKRHFKRNDLKLTERRATLTALARWGVTSEAEQLLTLHLRDGSLERLGDAALYAILVAATLDQRLQRLNALLSETRPLTLTLAIARSLIDRRLRWSALDIRGQRARLDLLKRTIEQLPRRGDARLVRDLQGEYLQLYYHLNPNERDTSDQSSDIAPSLSEEDD